MNHRIARLSDTAYGWLLRLLPAAFRRAFAEPMRQTFADLIAARLAEAGPRGVAAVWVRAVPDLVGGAAREWSTVLARLSPAGATAWTRYTGVATVGAATTLLVVSQALYPANLALPEYLGGYLGLFVTLTGVAALVLRLPARTVPAVALGLATCPLWLVMYAAPSVGIVLAFVGAAALIGVAAARVAGRGGRLTAALRASLVCAVTAAVGMLLANLTYSLSMMSALRHDPVYLDEYLHSGQSDLAAYIVGESIGGAVYAIIASPVLGIAFGLVGVVAGRIHWSIRPGARSSRRG
jgi:hypothetical protein